MIERTEQPQPRERLHRAPVSARPTPELTERDRAIFRHCHRCRLLSFDQLAALEGLPDGDNQGLRRRLRDLYDAGYLDRPRQQLHHAFREDRRYAGTHPLVYALGTKGAGVVADELQDARVARLNWEKKNRQIKWPQIEHALMVSEVYTLFTLATRESPAAATPATAGGQAGLHFWEQGEDIEHAFSTDAQKNHVPRPRPDQLPDLNRHVIAPDAFFCLTVPGSEPGSRAALYFFLECDRSTMSHARLLVKYHDYWRLNRANLHPERYGCRYFLVLTVTVSPERRDNLGALARQADDWQKGSPLFRFACLQDLRPEHLFQPVWRTPVDKELTDLFS